MTRQIVVLGIARGGTSMIAGVLHHLGVDMGPVKQRAGVVYTSYEDPVACDLNMRLLWMAGGDYAHPPNKIESLSKVQESLMRAHVAERDAEHNLWGFKDPRTCLTAHLWHPLLSDPTYVWIRRNRRNTVQSLMYRCTMLPREARRHHGLCERYIDEFLSTGVNYVSADYDAALRSPGGFVERLMRALDICCLSWNMRNAIDSIRPARKLTRYNRRMMALRVLSRFVAGR